MIILKDTASCKKFIADTINNDVYMKDELANHDTTRYDEKVWSRTGKSKIKHSEEYEWIFEQAQYNEGAWVEPGLASLIGYTAREFLHKQMNDGDATFIIITDDNDKLVAWTFMCD